MRIALEVNFINGPRIKKYVDGDLFEFLNNRLRSFMA